MFSTKNILKYLFFLSLVLTTSLVGMERNIEPQEEGEIQSSTIKDLPDTIYSEYSDEFIIEKINSEIVNFIFIHEDKINRKTFKKIKKLLTGKQKLHFDFSDDLSSRCIKNRLMVENFYIKNRPMVVLPFASNKKIVSATQITDFCNAFKDEMNNIVKLNYDYCEISNWAFLKEFHSLEEFEASNTDITGEDLKQIQHPDKIKYINLNDCEKITAEEWEIILPRFTNLEVLNASATNITWKALMEIQHPDKIKNLNLNFCENATPTPFPGIAELGRIDAKLKEIFPNALIELQLV